MKYIVFGCGETGKRALFFLGYHRVLCFASNYEAEKSVYNKEVVPYEKMREIYRNQNDIIIVVASEKFYTVLEQQLVESQIDRYFVFHEEDVFRINEVYPYYYLYKQKIVMTYTQVLARYGVCKYKKIAIYGVNRFLPYLIAEIMEQNPSAEIIIVVQKGYCEKVYAMGFAVKEADAEIFSIDALLLNVRRNEDDIREKLDTGDLNNGTSVIDLYDIDDFEPLFKHVELEKYKNLHQGKRIFVIGNGPSLRIDDLDTLYKNKEICIAFNKIYRIYDKTPWRATYLGFTDGRVIENCKEDIPKIEGTVFMGDTYHYERNPFFGNVEYFHHKPEEFYPYYPRFSDDFVTGFYSGYTVTYDLGIQLAAYMGASEIILLGVDHFFSGELTDSCNHFLPDYFSEKERNAYMGDSFEKEILEKAYKKAELYSGQHGFRIYNATRGGKLEVFGRVDFGSLFYCNEC